MLVGGAALMAGPLFAKSKDRIKLTILHTNDLHSRIEPFSDRDPNYAGLGGLSRISALVNQIKREEEHVLLFDSGDIFQGTPYFNIYGGELEFKVMSQIGYDASTLGNHDFDNGIDGLTDQLPHAKFSFVNCNYKLTSTPLKDRVLPYKIFFKGGIKIGVTGVGIELEGLVSKDLYGDIEYLDPIYHANRVANYLKIEEQCDLVVCLSHLGYDYGKKGPVSDLLFAKASKDIDLILGGHTHTFLETPQKIKNDSHQKVLINQVGWAGINLGRVDFYVDKWSNSKDISGTNLIVKTLV